MDIGKLNSVKRELAAAGVPMWAPCRPDDLHSPRFYAWVTDSGDITGALVGDGSRENLQLLREQCGRMLRDLDPPPRRNDAHEPCRPSAIAVVRLDGGGWGVLRRNTTRPLSDLIGHAEEQLERLADG